MQPIPNEPALFIDKKILVIADLHIGIESELKEQGINAPSQTKNMAGRLIALCEKYKPKEIILLGDIKHNIPASTIQERRDVRAFLETLQQYSILHIIPGNHDGNIQYIAPKDVIIHPSDGFVLENLGFVHGHRWPSKEIMSCKQLIMGHTHPTVMFTDRLGHKASESCWIKGGLFKDELNNKYPDSASLKVLIIPAFNPLCGGIAVNKEGITGPLGKIIDVENAQAYLIDGALLGKVKDIK